jgi:hypothetical protein
VRPNPPPEAQRNGPSSRGRAEAAIPHRT